MHNLRLSHAAILLQYEPTPYGLMELANATFFHPSYDPLFYPFLLKALLGKKCYDHSQCFGAFDELRPLFVIQNSRDEARLR